jgi:Spy/CpxP family protein refolding chaperone
MSDVDLSKEPIRVPEAAPQPVRRGVKPLVVAGLVAVAGIGGMVAARAVDGPGFGPGGWMQMMHRGPGGFMGPFGGPPRMDAATVEDRVDRGIRHLSIEIDATPEQQDKLRAIAKGLVKDLLPLRDTRAEVANRARSLLTAATVDKAEVEKFRAEQVARMDTVSKRIAQAINDVSDVLSAEQRLKIADRLPPAGAGPFGPGR